MTIGLDPLSMAGDMTERYSLGIIAYLPEHKWKSANGVLVRV